MKEERSADGSSRQKKRKQREKRGSVFCVCACVRACLTSSQYGGGNASASASAGKGKEKKARGAEMMMVVDRGGSLGEGPCHRLFWRLRLRLPGGCVRYAVCHIQCATFAQDYLLSLLSPNNFSPNKFYPQPNKS